MSFILSSSGHARAAHRVVQSLQTDLVARLETAAEALQTPESLNPVRWLRDEGTHGGGERWVSAGQGIYSRASVNVSAVHYDDLPERSLASATAISAIVHPSSPQAPSMHMHMSWTEMRDGRGYWRVMADLNPSIANPEQAQRFAASLEGAAGQRWTEGRDQGAKYFYIPALDRHRGVVHFYLEGFNTGDWDADAALATAVGRAAIDAYGHCVEEGSRAPIHDDDHTLQRAYHTLYLFQVLTLDRGTTSGLLVHSHNDLGIMGSLPSRVDPQLLASWAPRVPEIQRPLVTALVAALPSDGTVTDAAKKRLADAVRTHYRAYPEALTLQASGNIVPPTVANHRT